MSDLLTIFHKASPQRQFKSSQSEPRISSNSSPYQLLSTNHNTNNKNNNNRLSQQYSPLQSLNTSPPTSSSVSSSCRIEQQLNMLINNDSFAKKMLYQNQMVQQLNWYNHNTKLQGFINIIITLIGVMLAYQFHMIGLSVALTLFIYAFLYYGVAHTFFGTKLVYTWSQCSLNATYFVLIYLIFVRMMQQVSHNYIATQSYLISLLPSVQIYVMLQATIHTGSNLFMPIPSTQSIPQTIISSVTCIHAYISNIIHTRYIILATYIVILFIQLISVMLLINADVFVNSIGAVCDIVGISNTDSYIGGSIIGGISGGFVSSARGFVHGVTIWDIFSLSIVGCQLVTIVIAVMIHVWLSVIVKETVSNWLLFTSYTVRDTKFPINYSQRKSNYVPFLLELLRVQPSTRNSNNSRNSGNQQYIHQIHCKCLKWIINLITWNNDALNTQITTSKIYNTYWDILRIFIEQQLHSYMIVLLQLQRQIQEASRVIDKSYKQDAFIVFRSIYGKIRVWMAAIRWCKCGSIAGLVFRIICQSKYPGVWAPINIQRLLNQICAKLAQLNKNTTNVNPLLIKKMGEEQSRILLTLIKIKQRN